MRAYKVLITIVLFMAVYTLFLLPMDAGQFPAWLQTDMIQFMLLILCVACVIVLIR